MRPLTRHPMGPRIRASVAATVTGNRQEPSSGIALGSSNDPPTRTSATTVEACGLRP